MAGSPKKREREKAARLLAAEEKAQGTGATSVPALAPKQEVLPPAAEPIDVTRTALKRAMRAKAQEFAEEAIQVLAVNLKSADPRIATAAANDLLAWGFGKPAQEIEAGDGAVVVQLVSFRDHQP
jgi:hypothetical protein